MKGELLMVVGGGTGGHIYPGVAVAEAWQARGGRVVYVGSATGMEARVVEKRAHQARLDIWQFYWAFRGPGPCFGRPSSPRLRL